MTSCEDVTSEELCFCLHSIFSSQMGIYKYWCNLFNCPQCKNNPGTALHNASVKGSFLQGQFTILHWNFLNEQVWFTTVIFRSYHNHLFMANKNCVYEIDNRHCDKSIQTKFLHSQQNLYDKVWIRLNQNNDQSILKPGVTKVIPNDFFIKI